MSEVIKCCANCKYWDCYNEEEDFKKGECHRYPPSVLNFGEGEKTHDEIPLAMVSLILAMNTPLVSHPVTFDENWCGEFKAMDNPRWVDTDEEE